jgi:hypothetical protein
MLLFDTDNLKLTTWVEILRGNAVVPHLSRCFLHCMKEEKIKINGKCHPITDHKGPTGGVEV